MLIVSDIYVLHDDKRAGFTTPVVELIIKNDLSLSQFVLFLCPPWHIVSVLQHLLPAPKARYTLGTLDRQELIGEWQIEEVTSRLGAVVCEWFEKIKRWAVYLNDVIDMNAVKSVRKP